MTTTDQPLFETSPLTVADLRDGDVLTWTPANRHCMEGTAVVSMREDGSLYAADTFWGSGGGSHVLTATELAGATVQWNLNDFRPLNPRTDDAWGNYDLEDRRWIPSQHGLQGAYFLRPDAKPSLQMKVLHAEERLARAQDQLRSAEHAVEWAERELTELRAQQQ